MRFTGWPNKNCAFLTYSVDATIQDKVKWFSTKCTENLY